MDAQTYELSKVSIKTLKVDNYLKSYLVVLLDLTMLGAALSLFFSGNIFLYALGVALWALQMNHSYLIVHECAHGTFFKKARWNEMYGNIFAFFALLPFYSRRFEHLTHHRIAGSFDEPSTQRALKRFKLIDPKAAFFISICWKLWIPIFAFNEHVMLWGLPFQKDMSRKIMISGVIVSAMYLGTIGALLFIVPNGAHWLVAFLPVIYLYMVLIEFFNLPHHLSSPIEDRHGPVPYHEQAQYSRSCSPMPEPFGSWLVLNFNYHIAHHLYPAVHWTKINQAHEIMKSLDPSLGETAPEFKINVELRKKSLREALSKYFDYQLQASA